MRNKAVAARIEAALARHEQSENTTPRKPPVQEQLQKVRSIVERRVSGERNWRVREIAEREGIGYMTVYRALNGKPGWLQYGRAIRVTDSLYRTWLNSVALNMSLDAYLDLPRAS